MRLTIFLLTSFFWTAQISGQEFNKALDKDSIVQVILGKLPENKRAEFLQFYKEGNNEAKEFLLLMFSMPRSSKKELISNIDSNFENIKMLESTYLKLVPKGYIVSIEFNPALVIMSTKESIDLKIEFTGNGQTTRQQEWNLDYNSEKLNQLIKPLGWTNETLTEIKNLLFKAKCVSIENSTATTIGFARSGMGKYYFKLFPKNLTTEQLRDFEKGCTHIYYKKNIVLVYGGGAVGPQCFPD